MQVWSYIFQVILAKKQKESSLFKDNDKLWGVEIVADFLLWLLVLTLK